MYSQQTPNMLRLCLLFCYVVSILQFRGVVAIEEIPSIDVVQTPEVIKSPPLEQLGKITEPYDSAPFKHSTPIEPIDSLSNIPKSKKIKRQLVNWPLYPFFDPNIYFNPYYNRVSSTWLKSLVDQYKNDLEMIQRRQNLIVKSAECSSTASDKCTKVNQPDVTEDLRALNYWNWGYNGPDVEYVTYDQLNAVMNSFKSSIEKLTLRQNMLYEYLECSCPAKTECRTSFKPVLDVMFSNNGNVTGQLVHSLFVPGSSYYNPASSFFQTLASFFSQIPPWIALNFNPIASAFGSYQPFPTSSATPSSTTITMSAATNTPVSSTYATTSSQTTQTTPITISYSTGNQPVYSSSSSYSSSTGSGQQVSGGYVSTSGGGKPSQEHYFVSSNGDNIHVSSSGDGKEASISSSGDGKEVSISSSDDGNGKEVSVSSVDSRERLRRFADGMGSGFPFGDLKINAAQLGLNAAQAGIQAAQIGIHAGQFGAQLGAAAAQHGVNAAQAGIAAGLSAAAAG